MLSTIMLIIKYRLIKWADEYAAGKRMIEWLGWNDAADIVRRTGEAERQAKLLDGVESPGYIVLAFRAAKKELGVKEIKGEEHNPRILEYLAAVPGNFNTDEIPWCAAFVNWCLAQSNLAGTSSGLARSFLAFGVGTIKPEPGDIVILNDGQPTPDPKRGHVGFFVDFDDEGKTVKILGGNQSDMVSVAKFDRSRVLNYRTLGG